MPPQQYCRLQAQQYEEGSGPGRALPPSSQSKDPPVSPALGLNHGDSRSRGEEGSYTLLDPSVPGQLETWPLLPAPHPLHPGEVFRNDIVTGLWRHQRAIQQERGGQGENSEPLPASFQSPM
jgi:hypothetical protein